MTEGLGLFMLVPLLDLLGTASSGSDSSTVILAALGVPIALGPLLGIFVLLIMVRAVVVLARNLAAHGFEVAAVDSLRQRAWRALLRCEWRALAGVRRAHSASLLITSIDRVGDGLNQLFSFVASAVTLIVLGMAAFALAPAIAIGAASGGAIVLFAYRGTRARAGRLGEQLDRAYAAVYASFDESLGALRAVKSLGGEAQAEAVALDGLVHLRQAQRSFLRSHGLGQLTLQTGGAMVLAAIVWLAAARWQLATTAILPLIALFARALPLLGALQESWQRWNHARPALAKVGDLIAHAEAAREEPAEMIAPPAFTRELRLEGVTIRFGSEAKAALEAVSLSLPINRMIVLTGPSGAGKSTLADLAGGLISPDSGTILVDGVPLAGSLRQAWRQRVAYVQQDPVLLAATIRENLCWGMPDHDDGKLRAVLDEAAASFVDGLPDGLDTRVGDGGRTLSGGERQRLMLARGLLRDPALLILDEATSALDAANEEAIARVLARLKQRMAILVVAHRGALAALADQVVALEAGRIAAISPMNGRE